MNKKKFIITFFFLFLMFEVKAETVYELRAKTLNYKNKNSIIIAEGNAEANNQENKKINADKIVYYKNDKIIKTFGQSKFFDGKLLIKANNFEYNLNTNIISANGNVEFHDENKNIYFFKDLKYFEKEKRSIGNHISTKLKDGSYIQAKSLENISQNNLSKYQDVNYTTCNEIFNNNEKFCPSWSLNSKEVIHNKEKKTLIHKNSLLKIKNIPILYSPYFSHPDPSVKRQSGFLAPVMKNLNSVGKAFGTPYFWAISEDKDLTITPTFYKNENHLLQTSYRQSLKDAYIQIENGYTKGYKDLSKTGRTAGSRSYFFLDYSGNKKNIIFDENKIEVKLQNISQENFLRVNAINTKLLDQNIRILSNYVKISSFKANEGFDIMAGFLKDMDTSSDEKFTYILPEGNYAKNYQLNEKYNLNFNNFFQGRKFLYDQKQFKIRNKLDLNSKPIIFKNTGLSTMLKTSLLNNNIYNDNVISEKQNTNIDNYVTIALDNSLPFGKYTNNSQQSFVPRVFAKYTTGKTLNSKDDDKSLDYFDVYALNRTNNFDKPETGFSLGHGVDYIYKLKQDNKTIAKTNFSIGQVIRNNAERNMPTKSTLNNKSSDFVGLLKLSLYGEENIQKTDKSSLAPYIRKFNNNYFDIDYKFALNNDLNSFNKNQFGISGNYNTYNAKINFTENSPLLGNERYMESEFNKLINNDTYFTLRHKKNLITNSSEYLNFGMIFENECISYGLTINRDWYNTAEISSGSTVNFHIILKPFAYDLSPDVSSFYK